ncbi:glycosyltransferase family 4 protein [Luteimonas sp. MC1828]|nr:glycosyltransferase family 4 protein [Luteimonas sp. MC1828]MBJ7574385.1 glycosyltransferase family 4 protein [Luteimonas sp. MC1828]
MILAGFADSIAAFRGALIRDLTDAGCEVHIAAPELKWGLDIGGALGLSRDRFHDIPIKRTDTDPLTDLSAMIALWRLMRKLRPDVTLPYTAKPVIYGSLAAWLARVPRRFALVTGLGYAFTGDRTGSIRRIVGTLYRLAFSRVHKVFFQNPDDEREFREMGLLPANIPSVVVNGSGVDVASYTFRALPDGAPVFLLIGRLLGDKGIREYAEAARRIKAHHPRVSFRLVGWLDTNPDAIAQAELNTWTAGGTVQFLGRLSDVRPAIADSTVYVLPSYREGTPRTVLEAMAMGRPIITTDAPGCRETVVDGENGFLVPVRSVDPLVTAMLRFIDNPELAARMGARSRQMAEDKYDVHKVNEVMLREMGLFDQEILKVTQHG